MVKQLILLLLLSAPSWATWTLTQVKDTTSCSSPCAVTVTSTGGGHLLVAGLVIDGGTTGITISSVTAGACNSTWTHAASSNASSASAGSADLYYCTNSKSAQTSISISTAGSCGGSCEAIIWEASSSLGTIAIDSGATPSSNVSRSACSPCNGTSLTLSGNNDFIAALSACSGTCNGVSGTGCTNDLSNPGTNGAAHCITSGTGTYPATWTSTGSQNTAEDAAAFQETSGGATCSHTLPLMHAGCS